MNILKFQSGQDYLQNTPFCDAKLRFSHLWADACKDCHCHSRHARARGLPTLSGGIRVQHWGTHSLARRYWHKERRRHDAIQGSDLINLWAIDSRFMLIEVKVPIKHLLLFVCFRIPFYKLISYMYAQIATDQPNFQGAKWLWVLLVLIFSNLPIHLLEPRWLRGTRAAKAKSCSKCRMATTKEPTGQLPRQPQAHERGKPLANLPQNISWKRSFDL